MAGSYRHCIDSEGRMLSRKHLRNMLENDNDVYEAVEEMYGMIWFLADRDPSRVENARINYEAGIGMSPGTGGTLQSDEDY